MAQHLQPLLAAMDPAQVAMAVVLIAMGVVIGCLGYRIFRVMLVVVGLVAGMTIGWLIGFEAAGDAKLVVVLAGMVGGTTGMALFVFLYLPGVFLAGAVLGALIIVGLAAVSGTAPHPVPMTAAGLMCGTASLWFHRPMIVVSTAASGSLCLVLGALYFVKGLPLHQVLGEPRLLGGLLLPALAAWILLSAGAAFVQFATLPQEPVAESVQEVSPAPPADDSSSDPPTGETIEETPPADDSSD